MNTDKLYVIIVIGMIGIFIYWYQTRLDIESHNKKEKVYCAECSRKMIKRKDKKRIQLDKKQKKNSRSKKSKSQKRVRFKENDSIDSDDSIPDSVIEARMNKRSSKSKTSRRSRNDDDNDEETEISIDSLDSVDRSDASNSRRDDDTLDMVDGTIDSDADTIDLD
jgi:hypothetical protein